MAADAKQFQEVLKSVLWKDNVLRLKAQAQVRNTLRCVLWLCQQASPCLHASACWERAPRPNARAALTLCRNIKVR